MLKIYGNNCHYCHSLKDEYSSLSDKFGDNVLFYAFNIADYPELEDILGFEGIPTIVFIQNDGKTPRIRLMPEPSNPDKRTWYTGQGIKEFIERELV